MSSTPGQFGYATVVVESQTNVQGARTCIPEQSACYVTLECFTPPGSNGLGTNFVPNALRYRIDDVVSGSNIAPWSGIVAALTNQVAVTSFQNSFVSFTRLYEPRQVLFQITDMNSNEFYARAVFDILRVRGFVDNFVSGVNG